MHATRETDLIVTHGQYLTLVKAVFRFSRTVSTMLKLQPSFSNLRGVTMEAAGQLASKGNQSNQVRILQSPRYTAW